MTTILKVRVTLAILAVAATVSCHQSAPPSSSRSAAGEATATTPSEDRVWAGGIAPPVGETQNPRAAGKESAKDGERLFVSMNCDGCHGAAGSGWVGPSLADGRWRYGGQDEDIFASIFYGRPKGMPAFGGAIGRDGASSLVSYIKTLTKPDVVPTQSWMESEHGESAAVPPQPFAEARSRPTDHISELESSMQTNGCAACHALDRKIVGPDFAAVAKKYRGQSGAEQKLFASVKNGGVGTWGNLPMPPNPSVDDEQLRGIVKHILSLEGR